MNMLSLCVYYGLGVFKFVKKHQLLYVTEIRNWRPEWEWILFEKNKVIIF